MSRPKKNPEYDSLEVAKALISVVSDSYNNPGVGEAIPNDPHHKQLKLVAEEFGFTPLKTRKLLIAGNAYHTAISDKVNALYNQGKSVAEIQVLTGLSRASVHGYLPYSKVIYKTDQISVDAERVRLYRNRKIVVKELMDLIRDDAAVSQTEEKLWDVITLFQGYPFYLREGMSYRYSIVTDQIYVNLRPESGYISKTSVLSALHMVIKLRGEITIPEELDTIDAEYLYPMFCRFGIIRND